MIRVQQTCRANDKSRSGRMRVTSQRQDRYIRIIHLWNFMITAASKEHVIVHLDFNLTAKFCIKNQPICFLQLYDDTTHGPSRPNFD